MKHHRNRYWTKAKLRSKPPEHVQRRLNQAIAELQFDGVSPGNCGHLLLTVSERFALACTRPGVDVEQVLLSRLQNAKPELRVRLVLELRRIALAGSSRASPERDSE